jgi:hypothetical protein
MANAINGISLYEALKAEGFELPPECGDVELVLPVDGIFALKFVEFIQGERLAKLGRALERLGKARGLIDG